MTTQITESGMTFRFPTDNFCHIEQSKVYRQIEGFSVCECVVLTGRKELSLIEAKSSAPNPNGEKGIERFNEFLREIKDKFRDTLSVYHATLLRHGGEDIPQKLRGIPLSEVDYKLYLIINGHKVEWLPPLSNALKSEMRSLLHLWRINDANLKVMNEVEAKRKGLIAEVEA